MKLCKSCNQLLTLDKFTKMSSSKDGLDRHCTSCKKKRRLATKTTPPRMEGVKTCSKCKVSKSVLLFNKNKYCKDGRYPHCNDCRLTGRHGTKEHKQYYDRIYVKYRKRNDIKYRILCNLRNRLYYALVKGTKSAKTIELVGCAIEELQDHLESQFIKGMSWDNYGKWHLDHIRPCASFDLTLEEEQRKCFHYTNLQPLWAAENSAKGAKYKEVNYKYKKKA